MSLAYVKQVRRQISRCRERDDAHVVSIVGLRRRTVQRDAEGVFIDIENKPVIGDQVLSGKGVASATASVQIQLVVHCCEAIGLCVFERLGLVLILKSCLRTSQRSVSLGSLDRGSFSLGGLDLFLCVFERLGLVLIQKILRNCEVLLGRAEH